MWLCLTCRCVEEAADAGALPYLAVAGTDAAVAEVWDLQVLPPHLHDPAPGCFY